MSEINKKIIEIIKSSLKEVYSLDVEDDFVMVEIPKEKEHGDYATNIAMKLARELHKAPREIAESLKANLLKNELISNVEIAGP
ncbi:MAG: arginine--tRNA ligase, partial [Bacilli bacterium]|nr:arginine--tRNA ligase [Bacilli bacterium]